MVIKNLKNMAQKEMFHQAGRGYGFQLTKSVKTNKFKV